MSTTFSNSAAVSDIVTISGLSSIANGAYSAPSSLIDNTPSGPHGVAYINGLVRLSFSGALTAGSGAPYVALFRLVASDGSTLPRPPGSSAAAPSPNALQSISQLVASGSFQVLDFGEFELPPLKFALQVLNSAGVSFSGTATMTLYRWTPIGA